MILRVTIILATLVLSLTIFSQSDTLWQDSVRTHARLFFTEVEEIELVQLKSYCLIKKRPVGIFGRMKKVRVCYNESVMRSSSVDRIDTSHIGRSYMLNEDEHNYLFKLLYSSEPAHILSCYNPRHGIIFYDSTGMISGFIEICFECDQMYALPNTPNMGFTNVETFDKLKLLFEEHNLYR